MCFPTQGVGMEIDLTSLMEKDTTALLFAENSGLVLQSEMDLTAHFSAHGIDCHSIGSVTASGRLNVQNNQDQLDLDVAQYRNIWFSTSAALDANQNKCAAERFENYKSSALKFNFPSSFNGKIAPTQTP